MVTFLIFMAMVLIVALGIAGLGYFVLRDRRLNARPRHNRLRGPPTAT